MFTREFLNRLLTRAIKTFAQTAAALIAVDAATSIVNLDWPYILGVAATAFVLSVLTTVAEYGISDDTRREELAGTDTPVPPAKKAGRK